jgi:DNA-directed RNA polymerase specialized sigma24 family protein
VAPSLAIVTNSVGPEDIDTALDLLLRAEAPRLYRLARVIVSDPGEAEDAVQETLIVAWQHRTALPDLESPPAWLTRVCVRRCLRRRRGPARSTLLSPAFWSSARSTQSPPDLAGPLLDFHRALLRLSLPQRATFLLHFRDGLNRRRMCSCSRMSPGDSMKPSRESGGKA